MTRYEAALDNILNYFMFEPIDPITITDIEEKFRSEFPGNYEMLWTWHDLESDRPTCTLTFSDLQEEVVWRLKYT